MEIIYNEKKKKKEIKKIEFPDYRTKSSPRDQKDGKDNRLGWIRFTKEGKEEERRKGKRRNSKTAGQVARKVATCLDGVHMSDL